MHAAIIAGGFGTRAASMTGDRIPKALLPVGGIPIVFRQMRVLRQEGVTHLTVLGGHLGALLQTALEPEAAALGLALRVIVEEEPLGTGGCLTALAPVEREILLVYGDMLFDVALTPLHEFHRRKAALVTIVSHPNDHPRSSDVIVEHEGLVQAILAHSSPRQHDYRNLVPAGIYLASPAFFPLVKPGLKADMIKDVLPGLLAAGAPVAAYNTPEYLRDVGSPGRHELAERDLAAGIVAARNRAHLRPAIFFDCDGVLNEEPGDPGVVKADDVRLVAGAGSAVRRAHEAGMLTVAITNRPQVAKGLVSFAELDQILGRLEALLAQDGGVLDRVYFCPHHPDAGFAGEVPALKIRCECRKPGSLLFRQALADLPINQSSSMLVGDSLRDIAAARGVGIWAYGVRTGYGCRDRERYRREGGEAATPDLMFENVVEAVDFGLGYRALAAPVLAAIRRGLELVPKPLIVGIGGGARAGKTSLAHAVLRCLTEDGVDARHVALDQWTAAEAQQTGAPAVIIIDGDFALGSGIRSMLNLGVFVTVPLDLQRQRFAAFCRWEGLDPSAIEARWDRCIVRERAEVDPQQQNADLVIEPAPPQS
jgi:mannose-1-phosphate guanylyltransferase / phosphomannomutase